MFASSKKNLVLVGGGQTHAPVLKKLGMNPHTDCKITLISTNSIVPYSGMLPGYIAGTYTKEECMIDLRHISKYAGAVFVQGNVVGLDLKNKLVILENRPPIPYDILSLNVGIVPDLESIVGKEYVTPIKPAISFFYKWMDIIERIKNGEFGNRFRVGILGAGAGGIEIAFTMHKRLKSIIPHPEIHIFQRRKEILTGLNDRSKKKVIKILKEKQIHLHLNEELSKILKKENYYEGKTIHGNLLNLDFIVGAVKAKTLDWIEESEFTKDESGFVLVNEFLQSISHPDVFAVGDIASMQKYPRPKAGVFAVRQSLPLYKNILHSLENTTLEKFRPQENYLTLLNTGDGKAIASRGYFSLGASKWIWNWKNWIDTSFMLKFQNLPVKMAEPSMSKNTEEILQCRGCGSKASSELLRTALNRLEIYLSNLKKPKHPSQKLAKTIIGLKQREDSSLIQISKKSNLVQSVDYFKPIVDDLFIAGKIAANHALNDLYAKGVNGHSAQAIVSLGKDANEEDLFQLLAGASYVFSQEGVELLGGHTNSGTEFGIGFVCNGFSDSNIFYSKNKAKAGDVLILTKPIGVGLVFAAEMQNKVSPLLVDAAIHSMLLSNFVAMQILKNFKVGACTDVTGFGLAGHLLEILQASKLNAKLDLEKIPLLFELKILLEKNPEIQSSLFPSNWKSFDSFFQGDKTNPVYPLLFDPQTSGGLLFSLPSTQSDKCISELHKQGYDACVIGTLSSYKLPTGKLVECGFE
ncbi:MAG: selenide, water dikinase SelD [Leptospiraceae bacterium]|nr:selenide, water dikinase SelD [Leptospiraceae bacterium]